MEPRREDAMFPTILRSAAQAQHVFDCLQLLPILKYEAHLSYSYSYPVVPPRASTVTSYQLPIGSCSTSATQIDVLAPWQRQQQTQDQRGANVTPTVTVPPLKLEKLSSRASFLTFAGLQDATNAKLSREVSFPSAGSLKRSRESMISLGNWTLTWFQHRSERSSNRMHLQGPGQGLVFERAASANATLAIFRKNY